MVKIIFIIVAIIVLSAFGLHAIEFYHSHPAEFFGTEMQVVLHGERLKYLAFAIIMLFAFLIFIRTRFFNFFQTILALRVFVFSLRNQNNLFCELLRTGILHPKLCN
ncbi:MAG: hypothetical protein AAB362_01595 [Patescibacteria group bacterium]